MAPGQSVLSDRWQGKTAHFSIELPDAWGVRSNSYDRVKLIAPGAGTAVPRLTITMMAGPYTGAGYNDAPSTKTMLDAQHVVTWLQSQPDLVASRTAASTIAGGRAWTVQVKALRDLPLFALAHGWEGGQWEDLQDGQTAEIVVSDESTTWPLVIMFAGRGHALEAHEDQIAEFMDHFGIAAEIPTD